MKPGALPGPIEPKAGAATPRSVCLSSLSTFRKLARDVVNLADIRRINAPEVQGFLEQPETVAEIRQRMNSARGAQPVENLRVSFPLDAFGEIVQRTGHFHAIHT